MGAAGRSGQGGGLPDPQERRLGVVRRCDSPATGSTARTACWGARSSCTRAPSDRRRRARGPEQSHRVRRDRPPPSRWASLDLLQVNAPEHMGFLADKKILITGVLSNRSIAYGVARACRARRRAARVHATSTTTSRSASSRSPASSGNCRSCAATSRRTTTSTRCSRAQGGVGRARRPAAFDRLRAARGARRRFPREPVARGVRDRARHLELQLRGAGQGRASADAGAPGLAR